MPARPRIGPYELFRRLSRWERSEVWLARPLSVPDLIVAIEFTSAREPLCTIATGEARIAHPSVARCEDIGISTTGESAEGPGHYYVVRQLSRGPDLVTLQTNLLAAKTRMPQAAVLDCGSQLASAFHHAHVECGAIHGSLSPNRITIDADGLVRISGFVGDPRPHGFWPNEMMYWAPEHFRGEKLTPQTDVFSLGILLFELSTGCRLFRRDSIAEVVRAVLKERPPEPSKVRPELSWGLDRILTRALAVDPGERHPSAGDLARELDELRRELESAPGQLRLGEVVRRHAAPVLADQEELIARFGRVRPATPPPRHRVEDVFGDN